MAGDGGGGALGLHHEGVPTDAATNIEPAIGAVRLDKLTGARLDGFYRDLINRGLSPASVKRNHALLHAALGRAVKWGLVPSNPADRATPPQALTRPTVSAPAVGDVQRLLADTETHSPIVAAAIALAAVTGARRGELCALRWSDVDWGRHILTIARSLTVIDGVATAGDTKTHQRRTIALDDALTAVLARRRADQEAYAAKVGVALVADPFVLSPAADGSTAYNPDTLTDYYKRTAKRLGITTHFHELRHFAATTAIASGADVRTVAGRWARRRLGDIAGLRPCPRGTGPGPSGRTWRSRSRPRGPSAEGERRRGASAGRVGTFSKPYVIEVSRSGASTQATRNDRSARRWW